MEKPEVLVLLLRNVRRRRLHVALADSFARTMASFSKVAIGKAGKSAGKTALRWRRGLPERSIRFAQDDKRQTLVIFFCRFAWKLPSGNSSGWTRSIHFLGSLSSEMA